MFLRLILVKTVLQSKIIAQIAWLFQHLAIWRSPHNSCEEITWSDWYSSTSWVSVLPPNFSLAGQKAAQWHLCLVPFGASVWKGPPFTTTLNSATHIYPTQYGRSPWNSMPSIALPWPLTEHWAIFLRHIASDWTEALISPLKCQHYHGLPIGKLSVAPMQSHVTATPTPSASGRSGKIGHNSRVIWSI